ncbi:putative ankyrin repeat-containing domain, PGG domain, protein accelerated cell death 6 [Arabidopsis thaliana]
MNMESLFHQALATPPAFLIFFVLHLVSFSSLRLGFRWIVLVLFHEQRRQGYFSMNKINNGFRTLSSRGFLRTRGEATLQPMEDTQSVSKFLINLRWSDLFDLPGEYVVMNAETLRTLSDGNEEWLEKLRSLGTPLACLKNDRGESLPSHVAARAGRLAVVKALVASVTFFSARLAEEDREILNPYLVKDINGDTALNLALKGRYRKVALRLVKANKQASFLASKDGISPLYLAVEAGDVSLVKAMLGNDGPEGRSFNLEGRQDLAHAALNSMSTDILDVILNEYPSLVDERDEEGNSCLSFGASIGFYKGVCNLLDRSTSSAFECNDDGSFPIHVAVEKGHIEVVKEILKRCPYSKHLLNKKGQNILHIAAESGKFEILRHLTRYEQTNLLASEQDVDGNTPLHLATIKWRPRAVCELGGQENLLIQNNRGLTALDIAESKLKPHYIYREFGLQRYTLLVLVEAHVQNDPRCRHTMTPTRSITPKGGRNKDYINALLVVAALIATVTFTAGFTIPGGYRSSTPNLGMANLATNTRLLLFLIYDILALEISFVAVVSLILAQLGDPALYQSFARVAMALVCLAIYFMSLAFFVAMVIA